MVPITDSPSIDIVESANSVYELPSTKEMVRFLHAALGYPTKATMLTAAKHGNLVTFPGLTPENISRHFPESNETQKGHMKQTKQGVRSTKVVDEDAMLGFKPSPGVKHKDVYLRTYDATKKQMYSNQTRKFPIPSSNGHKYIMVAVELDGNFIDAEPIQSRTTKALTEAYQKIFNRWKATGAVSPNWHILDNEAPEKLKQAIRENHCRVELTPTDMHRRNAAEQAIQTFKGHFISIPAGVPNSFPINQWHELLPQTVLTLNLLRQSNVAPNISAWAYHHISFDYNRMPIAPMGARRKSFGKHSEDGFYLRTSEEHYRTHVIFVKKTRAKRLSDTVFFEHHYITQPTITPADAIVNAYNKLRQTLQGIQHSKEDGQMEALERIQQSLQPASNGHTTSPRVEAELTQQVPGVRFDEAPPKVQEPEPRLIVEWPKKQIVQPPVPKVAKEKPKPMLKPSKYIDESPDSVAARVKARRLQTPQTEPPQSESIADRVAQRRREKEVVSTLST
jgi:hypothetical protein